MSAAPSASFGDLPLVLAEIAEAGGIALAAAVARVWGGRRVYVPQPENLREHHPVARALIAEGLTADDVRALAEAVGGGWLEVPFGPFGGGAKRRAAVSKRAVLQRLADGETKAKVAERLDMSERRVYQIAATDGDAESEPPPLLRDALAGPGRRP